MEGASCPERPCDYAYANPVEITPPSLISRSTRTGGVPADASANQQSPPSVEARSPTIYIVTKTRTMLTQRTAYLLKVKTITLRMNVIEWTNIMISIASSNFLSLFLYLKIFYRISSDNY